MKSDYLLLILMAIGSLFFASCSDEEEKIKEEPFVFSINPAVLNASKEDFFYYRLTAKINDVNIETSEVTWISENEVVATVNEKGHVQPLRAGETTITGTLVDGRGTAKCKVIVTDRHEYKYRLILKDKGTSQFTINNPEKYLSPKAIEKRRKRNIPIDEYDLPISPDYLKEIEKIGGIIVAQSKWLNTVSVHLSDQNLIDKYKELPFVKDVVLVWKANVQPTQNRNKQGSKGEMNSSQNTRNSANYGEAWGNFKLNNGYALHEKGFRGEGIDIAVIDGGFEKLNTNPSLNNINILGVKSFVYEHDDIYSIAGDTHGVWVTSSMATNKPGFHIGTAPDANYWLFTTEEAVNEYPIEEDYWVSAIEYADSIGVDMVNTSLGYTSFYYPIEDHKYETMDGKTALPTRAANIAAEKGILVVCCSGNHESWIGTPGDSPNVLTVGSVMSNGKIGSATAWGITVDGRVKPDIVALGSSAKVIDIDGDMDSRSGSSYASPIMCGLTACLWQAYPQLTNKELLTIIRQAGDRYTNPEMPYGYGIADMEKAMQLAQKIVNSK